MSNSFTNALIDNSKKGKIKKDDAFELLKTLMNDFDDGQPILPRDLEPLIGYFMPTVTKGKAAKDDFFAVALAINDTDTRDYLRYVFSDGENLVASDGHRLHIIPTDLEAGFYCPKTKVKLHGNDFRKFPDYKRFIPKEYDKAVKLKELTFKRDDKYSIKLPEVHMFYGEEFICKVNEKYFNDVKTFLGDDFLVSYKEESPLSSLLLTDLEIDGKMVVLMPMK